MEKSGLQQKKNSDYLSKQKWLAEKGSAEFAVYQKEATTTPLTYDQWAASEHASGLYLAEIALNFWDLISSDDDSEDDAEPAPLTAPAAGKAPAGEKPAANGNGTRRAAVPAVAAISYSVEPIGIGRKKRRKSKKKAEPGSATLQDEGDDVPAPLPDVETVTPKPAVKKGKASKKFTPVTTHANETADPTTTPAANDAAPSGTAASPGSPTTGSATRPGLRTRTPAQQRPYFHHAKLFEEAIDKLVDEPKPSKAKSKLVHVSFPAEEIADLEQLERNEEESILEKPVGGKGRKKLNDDVDKDFKPPKNKGKSSDKGKSAPTAGSKTDEHALENGMANGETKKPKRRGRPPKARASLDHQKSGALDGSVSAQASAASIDPRSGQSQTASTSKEGKKKRVHKSEDYVHDSDEDEEMLDAGLEPEPGNGSQSEKSRRPAHDRRWSGRKSFLSSEYIHDSDDSEIEDLDGADNAQDNAPITEALHRDLSPAMDRAEDDTESALSDTAVSPYRTRKSTGHATTSAPGTAIASPSVVPSSSSAPPPGPPSGSPTSVRKKPRRKSKYTVGRTKEDLRTASKVPRRKKQYLSAEIIDDESDDDQEEMEEVHASEFDNGQRGGDVEMTDAPEESVDALGESGKKQTAHTQDHVANGTDGDVVGEDEEEQEPAPATTPRRTPGRPRRTPQSARTAVAGAASQGTPSKRGKKKSM